MNNTIKFLGYILSFIVATILFGTYTNLVDFHFTRLTLCSIVLLVILIVSIFDVIYQNKILEDKKYNIMLIIVNVIVLLIIVRDKFDPMIPSSENLTIPSDTSSGGLFIDYNTTFMTIMYISVLLYNLINKFKKT